MSSISNPPQIRVAGTSSTSSGRGPMHKDISNMHEMPSKILLDYVVPDHPSSQDNILRSLHPQGEQVILDHRGPVRLQLQPDGSFICEPGSTPREAHTPPAPSPVSSRNSSIMQGLTAGMTSQVARIMGAYSLSMGAMAGWMVLLNSGDAAVTPMQLFMSMSESVSCTTAGCITGFVLGPVIAATQLCKVLLMPAMWAGAAFLLHKGVLNFGSARRLVRQLNGSNVLRQLEAVRKVAVKAASSDKFRQLFHRHGGIETLLRLLATNPQGEAASMIANAIAHLVPHPACKDAVVSCSGVGLVAQLLEHHDPLTVAHAVQALAHLSSHSLAQEALKVQDVVPKLLSLVRGGNSLPYDTPQHALQALVNLAGDGANRTAMVRNGAVPMLTGLLRDVSVLSEVKAIAVALLHQLAKSNPDVAQALADIDDLCAILHRLLSALGPLWHPAKADIHALLTTLLRTPATLLGDTPVLVRPPPRLTPHALNQMGAGGSAGGDDSREPGSPRSEGEEGSGLAGLDYVTLVA